MGLSSFFQEASCVFNILSKFSSISDFPSHIYRSFHRLLLFFLLHYLHILFSPFLGIFWFSIIKFRYFLNPRGKHLFLAFFFDLTPSSTCHVRLGWPTSAIYLLHFKGIYIWNICINFFTLRVTLKSLKIVSQSNTNNSFLMQLHLGILV